MRYPGALAWLGLLTLGAAPAPQDLPIPPIPPDEPPLYSAAPMPNDALRAPLEAQGNGIRVTPSLFRREKTYTQGEGYMPGTSQRDTEQDRLNKPAPGLNVWMTLP
jgi:hypothetical protein